MAYKFQLGAFSASGSIKALDGFDANEQDIANVGDVALDSLTADNSSEITLLNNLFVSGTNGVSFGVAESNIAGDGSGNVVIQASGSAQVQFPSAIHAASNIIVSGSGELLLGGASAGSKITSPGDNQLVLAGNNGGGASVVLKHNATEQILVLSDGVNFPTHNGSTNGLKLNGTLVTATAAELNILDGATATATELNNLSGFAAAVYAPAADSVIFLDADGGIKSESNDDFLGAISDAGLEVSSNKLRVKKASDGALTFVGASTDELSVQLSGSSLSKDANGLRLSDTIPGARTFSDNVIIQGNLSVQGTTVTVDSTTIAITGSLQFEGATADGFETTFGVVDPTADATINLPAMGAGTYYVPVLDAASTTAISATPAELNLLDGGTAVGSSITIADSDGFIINDGGTMKSIPASDIKDYASAAVALGVASKADGATLATGMNYFADLSADATVTLPASPAVGDLLYVKAKNLTGGAGIIVNRAGSQLIDGQTALLLESPYAAVTLVYVATNDWRIV